MSPPFENSTTRIAIVPTPFNFSLKKTVEYKAKKFVEDQKKRLQTYSRQIVNLTVQTNPSLQAKPDKEQVKMLMPIWRKIHICDQLAQQQQDHQLQIKDPPYSANFDALMEAQMQNKFCIN